MAVVMHVTEVSSGGVLPVICALSNGIASKHEVIVVYGIRPDTPKNIDKYFDSSIKLIPLYSLKRKLDLRMDYLAGKELRRIVKKYKPDIVHFHSTKAGYIGRIFLCGLRLRQYYTPHGYSFCKPDNKGLKSFIYKIAEIVLSHFNCTTIACGKDEYEIASKIGKRNICIENGLDLNFIDNTVIKTSINEHDFTVYTVGRIGPQKNPQMVNELAKRIPEVPFVWLGGGADEHLLTSSNITVTGVLNREDVIKQSINMDCYISCSPSEGLPIALLEAMYLGKICIVSNVTGNKELIDDTTGFLFDGIDECERLIRLAKDNPEIMSEKCIIAKNRIITNYDASKMCRKYCDELRL